MSADPFFSFYSQLGKNIKAARYFGNPAMSQSELAFAIGVDRNTISNWERGSIKIRGSSEYKSQHIGIVYLFLIAKVLNLDCDFFFRDLPLDDLKTFLSDVHN